MRSSVNVNVRMCTVNVNANIDVELFRARCPSVRTNHIAWIQSIRLLSQLEMPIFTKINRKHCQEIILTKLCRPYFEYWLFFQRVRETAIYKYP